MKPCYEASFLPSGLKKNAHNHLHIFALFLNISETYNALADHILRTNRLFGCNIFLLVQLQWPLLFSIHDRYLKIITYFTFHLYETIIPIGMNSRTRWSISQTYTKDKITLFKLSTLLESVILHPLLKKTNRYICILVPSEESKTMFSIHACRAIILSVTEYSTSDHMINAMYRGIWEGMMIDYFVMYCSNQDFALEVNHVKPSYSPSPVVAHDGWTYQLRSLIRVKPNFSWISCGFIAKIPERVKRKIKFIQAVVMTQINVVKWEYTV